MHTTRRAYHPAAQLLRDACALRTACFIALVSYSASVAAAQSTRNAEADSAAKVAASADSSGVDAKKTDAAIPISFSVPESPAYTFLGVSPTKVTRASSARDLGASLLNAVDSAGNVVSGFALSSSLWTLLARTISLHDYQTRPAAYALANTAVSIGTARSTGSDSGSVNVALGIRTTFFDHSDLVRNPGETIKLANALLACLGKGQPATPTRDAAATDTAAASPPQPLIPVDSVPDSGRVSRDLPPDDPRLVCSEKQSQDYLKEWNARHWNGAALSWGVGIGWRIPGATLGHMQPLGVSSWLAGALPLGSSGQLLGQLQFDQRNARDTLEATSILTYGARAVRGNSNHNLFFEVAGTDRLKSTPAVSRSNVQWSGGIEFKIAEGYWISTGFGKRYAERPKADHLVLIANMRWGISSVERLRLLPGVK